MDKIIELLKSWELYENEVKDGSLGGFGNWLTSKSKPAQNVSNKPYLSEINGAFGHYFGMLIGYAEAWERLTFRNYPIKGFNDFFILQLVKAKEFPTKNEIAAVSTEENSTVFEAIKRLIRKGLLEERIDAFDKRVRRVVLTSEGKDLISKVNHSTSKLSNLIVGDLEEDEIKQMTQWLMRLGEFHRKLHQNVSKEDIAERYDL